MKRRYNISATQCQRQLYHAVLLIPVILLSSLGCGRPHASIVGKWVHTFGTNGNLAMVYEFHSDGTMTHYSQVDMHSQLPQAGVMSSPKFNGVYTFKQNVLTYHTTSIGDKDNTEALPNVKILDEKYKAILSGDTLTLSRILFSQDGPPTEYHHQ